jgi:replicative DNA helicase Mcm
MGGVIHLQQEGNNRDKQPTFEPYLQAHVPVQKESDYANIDIDDHLDEIRAIAAGKYGDPYDLLVGSIDPAVNGFEEVKLALGLALFGGTRVEFPDGTHQRGDSHIMLLGDPGIGKSDLIEYVEKVAPRSAFASGKDASGPGMTAAAVQDDFGGGGWTLEAGALVRADGGVACIDEIDKVGEETIASLHTALEKQVVEVQKAGIDASLPARCTCFAAGTPKYGRFEDETPLSSQIDFDAALLSRFDLIFMLQDRAGQNEKQEEAITDHMIDFTNKGIKHTADSYRIADDDAEDISPAIPIERLRAYIAYARENIHPRIEDEAIKADLKQSFLEFRTANTDPDQPIPVTRRKLQGIFRLAQASARVRLSPIIEEQDINRARELIGRCLRDVGIDPETGQLDADIIETGTSKNQRDRIKTVYSIIEDLAAEHDAGAPHGEVIERAGAQGISADDVDHEIESLKDQGEIYEPRQEGHYHIV